MLVIVKPKDKPCMYETKALAYIIKEFLRIQRFTQLNLLHFLSASIGIRDCQYLGIAKDYNESNQYIDGDSWDVGQWPY